jgi:hypothetical protein
MLFGVLILVVIVGLFALLVTAFVDALVRVPDEAWRAAGRNRATTIGLIVLTGGVGGLYYWLAIRPSLRP